MKNKEIIAASQEIVSSFHDVGNKSFSNEAAFTIPKISGIYKFQSVLYTQKFYIGSTTNIYRRYKDHLRLLETGKHHSHKLQRHFNKHGKQELIFIILESCSPEILIQREQYYIDTLNPYFNECRVAGSTLGRICKEETKNKISAKTVGREPSNRGIPHSEETKEKMRKPRSTTQNMRKPKTEQHKQNLSKARLGQPSWNKGKHPSAETLLKMSYNNNRTVINTKTGEIFRTAVEVAKFLGIDKNYFYDILLGRGKNRTDFKYL